MSSSPPPQPTSASAGFLAPPADARPFDRCVRCGVATPVGVALCQEHNPGRINGPSATQMHATILGGVLVGIVGFLFLMRLASSASGPFDVSTVSRSVAADGAALVTFSILNTGTDQGVADCRVTRDGVPRPDDYAFRTPALPAGESVSIERSLPVPHSGSAAYVPDRLSVICS
jgi:hypothetical protein